MAVFLIYIKAFRGKAALYWPSIVFFVLLSVVLRAGAVGTDTGVYTEGADKVEVAVDVAFNNPSTAFNAGDTVYVRVTTTRVASIGGGTLAVLNDYTGAQAASGTWTQTSFSSPYVYTTALTIPNPATKYLEIRGLVKQGADRFGFDQRIIINGLDQDFEIFRDSARTIGTSAFTPGATMYLSAHGSGAAYNKAQTGNASQGLFDYTDSAVNTWNAPASVTQSGNLYNFALTLPAGGLTDNWWYPLNIVLRDAGGAVIADMGRNVQIDETPPETYITAPTGGAELGGARKLITGSATNDISIHRVDTAITRDADGLYWDSGSFTWTASVTWEQATITDGNGTPRAAWQRSWDLPADSGGGYTIQARAVDEAGVSDPTPATVAVTVNNFGLSSGDFFINDNLEYVTTTSASLLSNVMGADEMRFAESTATLEAQAYVSYETTHSFDLSAGDGTKTVFAQFRAPGPVETTWSLYDTIKLDTIAPEITTFTPSVDKGNVAQETTIAVTFSDANSLDEDTIDGSGFFLKDAFGNVVGGAIVYEPAGKKAVFTSNKTLARGRQYTVSVTPAVRDAAGNGLETTTSWSFYTIEPHAVGPFQESADKIEIAADASFTEHQSEFEKGDTVYARVTTNRVSAIRGQSKLDLTRFDGGTFATANWIQTSLSAPYVFESSITVSTGTADYRILRGFVTDNTNKFRFHETIEIVGVHQHLHLFPNSQYLGESLTFEPGATVYFEIHGSGADYSAANTGSNSQRLFSFADADIALWNAPATVTRSGPHYRFSLTLPSSGLNDGWWYVINPMLRDTGNAAILDVGRFVRIDYTNPETVIIDPTGGTPVGATKLITGTATDTAAVTDVSVGIKRDADGYWWNGAGWVSAETYVAGDITSGQDTTGATWQYAWTLPNSNEETYTIFAKARDDAGHEDGTPARVAVTVDNQPPVVTELTIADDATYTASTSVTVMSSVGGASEMRFSEDLGALGTQSYVPYDTTYTLALTAGDGTKTVFSQFRDSSGNYTNGGALGTYDTIILDTTGPVVAGVDPPDMAGDVSTTETLTVDFDEVNAIDPATIVNDGTVGGSTFYLKKGADWTTASVFYNSTFKRAALTPESALSQGTTYTAYLSKGVKDAAGNTMSAPLSWSFGVIDLTDLSPPDTLITDPLGGTITGSAKNVMGNATDNVAVSTVTVAIARDADGAYWDGISATWTAGPFWNEATITAGRDTMLAAWQYTWSLPSADESSYTIQVRAADGAGNLDVAPASANVQVDNVGPAIGSFTISEGAPYTTTTAVTLDSAVTGATTMRFGETTAALSAAPYQPYLPQVDYALSPGGRTRTVLARYRDAHGNESAIGESSAIGTIVLDTEAPIADIVFPADSSTSVAADSPIWVGFSETNAMDPDTIVNNGLESNSTFYIKAGETWTAASASYNPVTKTGWLAPATALDWGTTYTVFMTPGVLDAVGNPLDTTRTWLFQTADTTYAPAALGSMSVIAGDMQNHVTWTDSDPAGDVDGDFDPPLVGGYNIYRSTTESGPWTKVNSDPITTTEFADPVGGSLSLSVYVYRVTAVDGDGNESDPSVSDDNGDVAMSKSTSTSSTVTMTSANGMLSLDIPAQSAPATITISTPAVYPPGVAPLTYVYQFEPDGTTLDASATLTFQTPFDPTGLIISANHGSGWEPLSGGNYTYNTASSTVAYDGVDRFSHFTVTETSFTVPHGTYLPTTTFCEVCHTLHGSPAAGLQRQSRSLRVEEDHQDTTYTGSWTSNVGGDRSSGSGLVSSTSGDRAELALKGNKITLLATRTPNSGRARVYIDGVAKEDIDLYNTTDTYQETAFTIDLIDAVHTMTVEVLGTKDPSSTGFDVEIDAFDILKPKEMGLSAEDEKAVCYLCHDGTGSSYDISAQFGETSGAPAPASSHPVAAGTVLCSDCHSPHASGENRDVDHEDGETVRLLRSDFGTYLGYVVSESNPWLDTPQPADLLYGIPEVRKLAQAYEVCGSCHGPGSQLPGGDVVTNFPAGGLKHDSTTTVPAGAEGDIACTSCHEWHVSDLPKLLESTISGSAVTGNDNSVCYACHDEVKIAAYNDSGSGGDIHGAAESTQASGAPGLLSPYGYRDAQIACKVCHDPHGSSNALWIQSNVNGKTSITVDSTASTDWAQVEDFCTACHTDTHNSDTKCTSCHFHGANADSSATTRF